MANIMTFDNEAILSWKIWCVYLWKR